MDKQTDRLLPLNASSPWSPPPPEHYISWKNVIPLNTVISLKTVIPLKAVISFNTVKILYNELYIVHFGTGLSFLRSLSPSCSSILSHSSRMKCLMWRRLRLLLRERARMRPGVPTTMWGLSLFSVSSSFFIGKPPKNTATWGREIYINIYIERQSVPQKNKNSIKPSALRRIMAFLWRTLFSPLSILHKEAIHTAMLDIWKTNKPCIVFDLTNRRRWTSLG